jgi:hypothetical protein
LETDFSNPNNFKGVYGLVRVNEILEKKIADTVNKLRGSDTSSVMDDAKHYEKRQEIKKTFEEIANQENRIYREKFLSIILIVVGIFIVSSQLMKDYFSFSGGGGTANTGGGGGGGATYGGSGGSGITIIKYAGSQRGTGGTVTTSGSFTVHTFTSSGTYTG